MKNPIYPCLWFENQAQEAAEFYCSVFENSEIMESTSMVITFKLNGKKFMGLNAGPLFKFNEAISFVVDCETQDEIDHYWERLTEGGEESRCGWLRDRYGVSWQIVPAILPSLMRDPEKGQQVVRAFMQMKKFDIATLIKAAND